MKTLHLGLNKSWFDMILSGEKKEEYRVIKKHWLVRLFDFNQVFFDLDDSDYDEILTDMKDPGRRHKDANDLMKYFSITPRKFDQIIFSNGRRKNCPQFTIECKGIKIDTGWEAWGAVPGKNYFVLDLGEVKK